MNDKELLKIIKQAARDKSTSLNLSSWNITSLPAEIGQLTNLKELNLRRNQLTSLPAEIGQLINLELLDLYNNQLTNLPAEIGQLTDLEAIDLSHNRLKSLPVEIGRLSNLEQLYLSNNQLMNLSAEIGQLTNLKKLYLSDNQLTSLPAEIVQLTKLEWLYLHENPLPLLPPEIREKGVQAILNFYRQQLEQETDRLYEAKLLIVGEAGAGKTTLAKKIQDSNYQLQQDETSTEGIDVIQWHFPLENGKDFRVNIWDFGGQEIYHATHQFFLTKRSFYALVADTRNEDTDFYYWLNIVELLSGNSPLLIVKNEKQDRQREINERQLRGEFTHFKDTCATNLATNRGLPELLKTIKHYISNLPHVGTELPKSWIEVRETLERESRNHISLEEYLTICQENGFTKLEDKLQLSGYLHDLGVCLHFQEDDLLNKTVILKPTWGTDAVYKVLDNATVRQNLGKFDRNDLANIWHEDKYATMRAELLRLMMNFKLCYEIPSCQGIYIAPQLLSPNQPVYEWDDSKNLFLRYEYEFMPKGILTRFIVEIHAWIEEQKSVWKTGVVLNKDQARAEVIERYRYHKGEIRIRIAGKRKRDLLTTVRHELDKIHHSYERLRYSTLVPCNCPVCQSNQIPYFYPLEDLYNFQDRGRNEIQCRNSVDMVDVRALINDVIPERDQIKHHRDRMRGDITEDDELSAGTTINIKMTQENPMSNINQHHFGRGDNVAGNKTLNQFNNSPNLAQAARDIKELLDRLSQDYPSNTPVGQATIAARAIEEIDDNPTLKHRVVNALTEAGATALEEAVDHPAIKIVVAGAKGFMDA